MSTNLRISLPAPLREWVERQIEQGSYGTPSDYFRHLLREEQRRQLRLAVEDKLREALDSGAARPVTDATWNDSEKRVEDRIRAAAKKRQANATNC